LFIIVILKSQLPWIDYKLFWYHTFFTVGTFDREIV